MNRKIIWKSYTATAWCNADVGPSIELTHLNDKMKRRGEMSDRHHRVTS